MSRVDKISITLWLVSLGIFYWSHYYYIYLLGSETKLATLITWFTALFNEPKYTEPSFISQGFHMYEEKAIQIFFCLAVFCCITSVALSTYQATKVGFNKRYYQIFLVTFLTAGCITYVAFKSGLAYS